VYVAIAPTYPECDEADLRRTLDALASIKLVCIYHEPINIRADNVERMKRTVEKAGQKSNLDVFLTRQNWVRYSMNQLFMVQRLAAEYGLLHRLKLWPDPHLHAEGTFFKVCAGNREAGFDVDTEAALRSHERWLHAWWNRLSPWPGVPAQETGKPRKFLPTRRFWRNWS